jgi:asparagine synthase (glutamine-hydrolysing)
MEFFVLPDTRESERAAEEVLASVQAERPHHGPRAQSDAEHLVLRHASGRPWIVGRGRSTELVHARVGTRGVALLGCTTATAGTLAAALERARTVADLDRLALTAAGGFWLVATIEGETRVQGSAGGSRQIFYAVLGDTVLAADRPDTLAAVTNAGVATEHLARHLLYQAIPVPLNEHSLWEGVRRLAPDHYLVAGRDGSCRTERWWTPPDPEVPLATGVEAIRTALRDSVAARLGTTGRVSADLSGGTDSTSLCFLASALSPELLTYRFEARDDANDDHVWASRAARALPNAEHRVVSRADLPLNFSGLLTPDPDLEGPYPWIRVRDQLHHQARDLADAGSRSHLTGHNGDQLFQAVPNYDHALVRSRPVHALRALRVHRTHRRWKLVPMVRALADNRSYGQWLVDIADVLHEPQPSTTVPSYDWGMGARMPLWATGDAVATVAAELRAMAGASPLHPLRAQHTVLQSARHGANVLRRSDRITERYGVSWHGPYTDDRVLEAALAIRFEDRATPNTYKRPLVEAMHGTVPGELLSRATKAEFSAEVYAGLRENRGVLLELCDTSRLAELGLIDPARLRAVLLAPHPRQQTMIPLTQTLAAEAWLRSVEALHPAGGTRAREAAGAVAARSVGADRGTRTARTADGAR